MNANQIERSQYLWNNTSLENMSVNDFCGQFPCFCCTCNDEKTKYIKEVGQECNPNHTQHCSECARNGGNPWCCECLGSGKSVISMLVEWWEFHGMDNQTWYNYNINNIIDSINNDNSINYCRSGVNNNFVWVLVQVCTSEYYFNPNGSFYQNWIVGRTYRNCVKNGCTGQSIPYSEYPDDITDISGCRNFSPCQ